MRARTWFLALAACGATVAPAVAQDASPQDLRGAREDFPGARVLRRLYDDCARRPSTLACLKGKAVAFFDRASRQDEVPLGDFAALVRESRADAGRALGENEVESAVAAGGAALDDLLFDRVARFLDSRSVRLSLPKVSGREIARGLEEGRKIKDKIQILVMYAIIVILSLI